MKTPQIKPLPGMTPLGLPVDKFEDGKQKFIEVMHILSQVWEGTNGADEILDDVCLTFAYEMFGMKDAKDCHEFRRRCREIWS